MEFTTSKILERVFEHIRKPIKIHQTKPLNITISAGVSIYPTDDNDIDEVIKKADKALNAAKKSGKNKYIMFNEIDER